MPAGCIPERGKIEVRMALHGVVHTARIAVERHLKLGDIAVDATVGAGFDTLYMARAVGPGGRVYGFDIQDEALERARATLSQGKVMERITLFKAGHELMPEFLPEDICGKIKAFTFNLGYLPGSDQQITTSAKTSLAAIETAMELLHPRGIISVAIYSGHPQGENEKTATRGWISQEVPLVPPARTLTLPGAGSSGPDVRPVADRSSTVTEFGPLVTMTSAFAPRRSVESPLVISSVSTYS